MTRILFVPPDDCIHKPKLQRDDGAELCRVHGHLQPLPTFSHEGVVGNSREMTPQPVGRQPRTSSPVEDPIYKLAFFPIEPNLKMTAN